MHFKINTRLILRVANPIRTVRQHSGHPGPSGRSPGLMATPVPTSRSDGRSERRIPQVLAVEISISEESVTKEATVTENVSLHGARVTAVRRWLPDTRVLVTFLRNGLRSEGRVVYCQPKGGRTFAIGIELYPDERKAA